MAVSWSYSLVSLDPAKFLYSPQIPLLSALSLLVPLWCMENTRLKVPQISQRDLNTMGFITIFQTHHLGWMELFPSIKESQIQVLEGHHPRVCKEVRWFSSLVNSINPSNEWLLTWHKFAGWWFQIFFIFTPIWGRFLFWLIFFRWVETTNQVWWFFSGRNGPQKSVQRWWVASGLCCWKEGHQGERCWLGAMGFEVHLGITY